MSCICQEIVSKRESVRAERKIVDIRRYRRKVQAEIRRDKKRRAEMNRDKVHDSEGVSFDTVEVVAFLIFTVTMIIKTVEVMM